MCKQGLRKRFKERRSKEVVKETEILEVEIEKFVPLSKLHRGIC